MRPANSRGLFAALEPSAATATCLHPLSLGRTDDAAAWPVGRLFDVANDPLERRAIVATKATAAAETARKKLAAAIKSMPAEGRRLLQFGAAEE